MTPKALHKSRAGCQALLDEDAARAMLELTNPAVISEEAAAKAFAQVAGARPSQIERGAGSSFATSGWEAAQRLVLRWLPKVSTFDRLPQSSRSAFLAEFNQLLSVSGVKLRIGTRGLLMVPTDGHDSIEDACVRAFIPFLIPNGWSPTRLGRCQFEDCGRWFLRPEAKRGSVPQYCDPKHATLARVREFRKRQDEAQGQQQRRDRRRR
jgi:hypothetical protein